VRARWQSLNYNVKSLLRHNALFTLVTARGRPHERVYIIFCFPDEALRYQAIQHEAANPPYSSAQKHIKRSVFFKRYFASCIDYRMSVCVAYDLKFSL
jgi:hypothetical protein